MSELPSSELVVRTDGLDMVFGEQRALDALDLEIPRGVTGLVGANGAGKSTLMSILLGLQFATAGSASVLGLDPVTDGPTIRTHVGWAPERNVFPDDMKANDFVRHMAEVKGLPPLEARQRASDSLWLVGLGEERFRLLGTMSTGQRQRVKLAQALAGAPRLILLDEPTDGLDPMQREAMLDLVSTVNAEFGIDIILSSHLLEEVERICDHVVAINAGRLVAQGTVDGLLGSTTGLQIEIAVLLDDGPLNRLVDTIRGAGDVHVDVDQTTTTTLTVTSDLAADDVADRCRDALAAGGIPLRSFGARRRRLEELFTDEMVHA